MVLVKSGIVANQLKTVLLDRSGIAAVCFNNCSEAIRSCQSNSYDLVFADSTFGMQDIEALAKRLPSSEMVVMECSLNLKKEWRNFRCKFLRKPIREEALKELLMENSTPKESVRSLSDIRILVVEDNPMNQLLLVKLLKNLNCQESNIVTATDGKEAVEKVRLQKFDIVLMDVNMPIMDGIKATRIIREEIGESPVIVGVTTNMNSRDKCIECGMQDFLPKPYIKHKLQEMLNKYYHS